MVYLPMHSRKSRRVKRGNTVSKQASGMNWKGIFLRTLPVMAGYLVLGIGFGIVMVSKGYGPVWSLAMGGLIYAGSMQYVAADLLSAGAGLITAALTTLLVNARHLFYGISMLERYRDTGLIKPYLIFGLTDETYSLVCGSKARPDESKPAAGGESGAANVLTDRDLFRITLMDHAYWTAGCLLGGIVGTVVPWDFAGVDFALTALFVCIFTEQWLTTRDHTPALIGLGATALCLLLFGAEQFLLPAMALIVVLLNVSEWLNRKKGKESEEQTHA